MSKLQQYTIMVALHLACPGLRRPDKDARRELADSKGTEEKAWSVSKLLFPHDPLKPLRQFDDKMREQWFNLNTALFLEGMRITRITKLDELQAEFRDRRDERRQLVEAFTNPEAYERHKDLARQALNGEYDEANYPHPSKCDFTCELQVLPVPDKKQTHLLCEVTNEMLSDIEANTEHVLNRCVEQARNETLTKIMEPLVKLTSRVKMFPQLWDEMRQVSRAVDSCNITGDPAIDELRQAMLHLTVTHHPDACLKDDHARSSAQAEAKSILSRMQSLLQLQP